MKTIEEQNTLTQPTVVQVDLCLNHPYYTLASVCHCKEKLVITRYAVAGTDYGYLHTTGGSMRLWKSKSGAYKAAANYRKMKEEQ